MAGLEGVMSEPDIVNGEIYAMCTGCRKMYLSKGDDGWTCPKCARSEDRDDTTCEEKEEQPETQASE